MDLDPQQLAQQLVDANAHGQEQLSLALVVLLSVYLARKFGPKLPGRVGAFFGSGYGGMALSFLIGQIGAVVTSLEAGKPLSLQLVLSGVVVSLLGSGLHAQVKQVKQSRAKKVVAGLIFLMLPFTQGCAAQREAIYAGVYESVAKVEKINGDFAKQFPTINQQKINVIIASATNEAQGRAELGEWKKRADRLVATVEGTHAGSQAVRDNVEQIRKGLQDPKNLKRWVLIAKDLAFDLTEILELSGIKLK